MLRVRIYLRFLRYWRSLYFVADSIFFPDRMSSAHALSTIGVSEREMISSIRGSLQIGSCHCFSFSQRIRRVIFRRIDTVEISSARILFKGIQCICCGCDRSMRFLVRGHTSLQIRSFWWATAMIVREKSVIDARSMMGSCSSLSGRRSRIVRVVGAWSIQNCFKYENEYTLPY